MLNLKISCGGGLMVGGATCHRSEGRFYIGSEETRVTLNYTGADGTPRECVGWLADLSLASLSVDVASQIKPDQDVKLRIGEPGESISLERSAVIRSQQPRDTKTWRTSCEFIEPLESDVIERLAAAQVLNRRRDARCDVEKPARVRAELSKKVHDVRLINYSKGGFCLLFSEPVELPHERLMLLIPHQDGEVTVPARVMWTGEFDNAFGVGCSFSTKDGFVQVRAYADPSAIKPSSLVRRPVGVISSWIAVILVLTILLQLTGVIQSRPGVSEAIRQRWVSWVAQPFRHPIEGPDVNSADEDADG